MYFYLCFKCVRARARACVCVCDQSSLSKIIRTISNCVRCMAMYLSGFIYALMYHIFNYVNNSVSTIAIVRYHYRTVSLPYGIITVRYHYRMVSLPIVVDRNHCWCNRNHCLNHYIFLNNRNRDYHPSTVITPVL